MRRLASTVSYREIQLCGSQRRLGLSLNSGSRPREHVHVDFRRCCFRQHSENSLSLFDHHRMLVRETSISISCLVRLKLLKKAKEKSQRYLQITTRKGAGWNPCAHSMSSASSKARTWRRREGSEPSASGHSGSARPSSGTRTAGCSHAAAKRVSVHRPIGAGQRAAALQLANPARKFWPVRSLAQRTEPLGQGRPNDFDWRLEKAPRRARDEPNCRMPKLVRHSRADGGNEGKRLRTRRRGRSHPPPTIVSASSRKRHYKSQIIHLNYTRKDKFEVTWSPENCRIGTWGEDYRHSIH